MAGKDAKSFEWKDAFAGILIAKGNVASTQISNLLCFGRLSFLITTCLFGLVVMTDWSVSFGV